MTLPFNANSRTIEIDLKQLFVSQRYLNPKSDRDGVLWWESHSRIIRFSRLPAQSGERCRASQRIFSCKNDTDYRACSLSGRSANRRDHKGETPMKHRFLLSLSLAIAACAFFTARSQAQQKDPDFSNVNDILHGNRTLLQITDLEVVSVGTVGTGDTVYLYQATTSNSSLTTNTSLTTTKYPATFETNVPRSFSGWMFNQPQAITVTEINERGFGNQRLLVQNLKNSEFWLSGVYPGPAPVSGPVLITGGAMADFNQDGMTILPSALTIRGALG